MAHGPRPRHQRSVGRHLVVLGALRPAAIRQASIVSSSKSSSMIDLPSSMIPAIPSQCLPRTFSSRLSKTLVEAFHLTLRFREVRFEGLAQWG